MTIKLSDSVVTALVSWPLPHRCSAPPQAVMLAGRPASPAHTQLCTAELLRKTLFLGEGSLEMDTQVPGVTNSKKHFIITLQHINSLGPVCAFWQLGAKSHPPGSCLPSQCTVHWVALALGLVGEAGKEPAAQSHRVSPCRPVPVICWGCGWCGRSAPRASGRQRRGGAGPRPV